VIIIIITIILYKNFVKLNLGLSVVYSRFNLWGLFFNKIGFPWKYGGCSI